MGEIISVAWIVFKKEVLRHRSLLILWLVALALPILAAQLGWLTSHWMNGYGFRRPELVPLLADVLFYLLVVVIPASLVMDDSRARPERFLATRPFVPGAVILGKIWFLVAVFVVPVGLQEFALAQRGSVGAAAVLIGVSERCFLIAVMVMAVALFSSLWSGHLKLMLGAMVAGLAFVAVLLGLAQHAAFRLNVLWFFEGQEVWALAAQICLLVGFSVWVWEKFFARTAWLGLIVSLLIGGGAAWLTAATPWRGSETRPANAAAVTDRWENRSVGEMEASWSVGRIRTLPRADESAIRVELEEMPQDLPESWEVTWTLDRF